MKTILIRTTFFLFLILSLFSCKTAEYAQRIQLTKKLPALKVDLDWLSIETCYSAGTTVSTGNSYSKTAYGTLSTIAGDYPGSVTAQSTTNVSQFMKNPQIKWVRDRLFEDTYIMCDKFGSTHGTIIWTVNKHYSYQDYSWYWIGGFLLGVPMIFGEPYCKYEGGADITANIYNSKNNLIATYSSEKLKRYFVAMWWGYSNSTANSMAYNNPFTEAMTDIMSQIENDNEKLTNELLNPK